MKIKYELPFCRAPLQITSPTVSPRTGERPPRIARLVALAHRLDELVRSGAVSDQAALARLGHISPARLTQIMVLLHLSPAIQEYLLFLPAAHARFVTEPALWSIAREPLWERQQLLLERVLKPSR